MQLVSGVTDADDSLDCRSLLQLSLRVVAFVFTNVLITTFVTNCNKFDTIKIHIYQLFRIVGVVVNQSSIDYVKCPCSVLA